MFVPRTHTSALPTVTDPVAASGAGSSEEDDPATELLDTYTPPSQRADSDTRIATDLVNLYRALGGGWEVLDVAGDADRALRQRIGIP